MVELTFFEKLGVLGTNILAHPIFILLLLSPALIFALNKKIKKKFIIAIYLVIIAVVLIVGGGTIFELLDNVIDGIFMVIYFPNFVTLFIIEVASAIIALITFLRKKMLKVNKVINITAFAIIQTIFCLILTVVQVNDINIYEENALYSNSDVLTLMQLLTGTFVVQLIAVIVFNAIEKVTQILDAKDEEGRIYRNIERAKILTKNASEELFELETKPDPKLDIVLPDTLEPLDYSLISKDKISPVNLSDAINEEQSYKSQEKPSDTSPELKEKEEILTINPSPENPPKPPLKTFINPNLPKIENSEEVLTPILSKPEISELVHEKILPIVRSNVEKPLENISDKNTQTKTGTSKELITGLQILNLEKTIIAIKNIQRVYTM